MQIRRLECNVIGKSREYHKSRVLRVALGKRARTMVGERVDVAAHVDASAVDRLGLVPGTLRDRDHARHDAGGHLGGQSHDAAVVEDFHEIAFGNAARLGVVLIHTLSGWMLRSCGRLWKVEWMRPCPW